MKILFVRAYCPNPIIFGSEMRFIRLVDHLCGMGQVDLLTLTKPDEKVNWDYINAKFRKFHYFDHTAPGQQKPSTGEKWLGMIPWQLLYFYTKDIQKKLDDLLSQNQYDLIFVFKMDALLYFLNQPAPVREKTVMDFDDVLSDLYLNYHSNFFAGRKNSLTLRFYEEKAIRRFQRVFVCSQDAVLKIAPPLRTRVGIIPNIFAASAKDLMPPPASKDHLLFVGSLDYFLNVEGLKWFFQNVWPEFRKRHPHVTLSVVGKAQKGAGPMKEKLGHPEGVEVEVNVPALEPYYERCYASIVPLLNGSGTRLKILESSAWGRPVISTPKGWEGLDFKDGKDLCRFEDAASFIKAYESLKDDAFYGQITRNAFQVLQDHYSLKAFEAGMDKNLRKPHA